MAQKYVLHQKAFIVTLIRWRPEKYAKIDFGLVVHPALSLLSDTLAARGGR